MYEHPLDPTSLIKLSKPETCDEHGNLLERRFSDRFRRATAFRDFLREFQEYLELKARFQQPGIRLPLCEVRGIVQTDLGIGLVYERIANPDGRLAPTLKALMKRGDIGQQQISEIEDHFNFLMENRIVVSNFNSENIIYQSDPDGSGRFIWIDSFGSKQFIPTRRWFKTLNDRKLRSIRDKCLEKMYEAMAKAETNLSAFSNAGAQLA